MEREQLERLERGGVQVVCPESQYVAEDVPEDAIAEGVVLHPGCRISGASTMIGPGCALGAEGPVTLRDCQLEADVTLKGGSFEESVFLRGSGMGSCAHVRAACLLEEEASGAHAVGLKQTVFMSFVTAGSLINFCDALMGGGTSRSDHSEIGSSYIHFNYTPHGDKATASLLGDVPRGVLLNNAPIFLGGQGGLVGPARVEFGVLIPAGTVFRGDAKEAGSLHSCAPLGDGVASYDTGVYRRVMRIVRHNLSYLGNIYALRTWYARVRQPLMEQNHFSAACCAGAVRVLDTILSERMKRLAQLADKVKTSAQRLRAERGNERWLREQEQFVAQWPEMQQQLQAMLKNEPALPEVDTIGRALLEQAEDGYVAAVGRLSEERRAEVVAMLGRLVERFSILKISDKTEEIR
jgi:UDP-N-acetylglucosamine/UDP-N-acetylgalactosamine diphosphorylase